ncbi:hypothetical protein ACI65C_013535 [Semiaphis heraclei]
MNYVNDEQIAELLVGDVSDIEELNEEDEDDNLDEFFVVEQNFHDENYKVATDNWFNSYNLQCHLKFSGMLGIGTVRTNRLSGCTFKNEKDMKKSGRGTYDTKVDTTNKIVATKWYDNKFVHVVSNYKGIQPLDEVERWSTAKKERVVVPRPASIKEYNRAFREVLKRRASSENLTLRHIYDEEGRRNPEVSSLYPYSTAESIMKLARRSSLPSLPHSLAELAGIFDEGRLHRYSCCGEIMFKGCVHDVDGRASMIFSCTTLLQLVLANNVDEVHVDATFKVVLLNMGSQFLIIHCMIDNYSIPIVYCLMECKTRNTYNCVFNFLKTYPLANLNPSIVITDYETALRDTLMFIFPTARITGCWFHHNQVSSLMKTLKLK